MYRTKVRNITDLKQRISDAIATIDVDMLQRTWQEIEYNLDVLRLTNGAHYRNVLNEVKKTLSSTDSNKTNLVKIF